MSTTRQLRLPITLSILKVLLLAVPTVVINRHVGIVLQAMLILGFHACLRIGEMIPACKKQKDAVIQLSDLQWQNKNKQVVLTLRKFKNSGKQGPQTIMLRRATKEAALLCPVRALRKYLQVRGSKKGPLFTAQNEPVLRRTFDKQLAALVGFCGYDPKLYKGHSLRIGAATEAAAQGKSDSQIRNLGRWRSDAFKRYIRLA